MCVCLVPLDQEVVAKCRGIGQTIVANQGRVPLNIATGTFFLKQAMNLDWRRNMLSNESEETSKKKRKHQDGWQVAETNHPASLMTGSVARLKRQHHHDSSKNRRYAINPLQQHCARFDLTPTATSPRTPPKMAALRGVK